MGVWFCGGRVGCLSGWIIWGGGGGGGGVLSKLMYFNNTYNIKVMVGVCGWMVVEWFGRSVGGRVGFGRIVEGGGVEGGGGMTEQTDAL